MTFGQKILRFLFDLQFENSVLPDGFDIMIPWTDPYIREVMTNFYSKYYNDHHTRNLILGINPGRLGAGSTGIPFTDPKRLIANCQLPYTEKLLHEPSSQFIYEMILACGNVEDFYKKNYISSVCPIGFTYINNKGNRVNINYYDNKGLKTSLEKYIVDNIKRQIEFGINSDICYCLGTGKNYKYLSKINSEYGLFGKVVPLAHPRYIMQYKSKEKESYIRQYVEKLCT